MRSLWVLIFFSVFTWSAMEPKDYLIWSMEIAPAVIGFLILAATYRRFPLTRLLYGLILLHCIVLMIGGHYTYAEVPLFDQLKTLLGFERNNYDKIGHFLQGFVPAMIAREILIRRHVVESPAWRNVFIVSICLSISALYELIEWGAAVAIGASADAFLSTQGYVWDTQADMAFALTGAISALLLLGRMHDSQLRRLMPHRANST